MMMRRICAVPLLAAWGSAVQAYARTITFSGYTWQVKTSTGRVGPGPNYFSDKAQNVWVDANGRLHLKITRAGGKWYCGEVVLAATLGYGSYEFRLNSAVDSLDPNVVLGLFTWNDDPAYAHRELDIEFSRWAQPANQNAQYVVQPYTDPANMYRFDEPPGFPQTTHTFLWTAGSAWFRSWVGLDVTGSPIASKQFTQNVPPTGGENARMNLWLFNGRAPSNRKEVEVVIDSFRFTPAQ